MPGPDDLIGPLRGVLYEGSEAMQAAGATRPGTQVLMYTAGETMSWHHVPAEQFVHLLDLDGSCLCGPNVITSAEWTIFEHSPLDQLYYDDDDFVDA